MRKRTIATTTTALVVLGAAGAAFAAHAPVYDAELLALNASGAEGTVSIDTSLGSGEDGGDAPDDASMTITIESTGLAPDLPHAQHLHMPAEGSAACPVLDLQDADGDGLLTVLEGAPAYGGVVLSLTTNGDFGPGSGLAVDRMPVADSDGNLSYTRTFEGLDDAFVAGITTVAVVQHGVDLDGSGAYDGDKASSLDPTLPFEATAPATCGTVELSESFGVSVDRLDGQTRFETAAAFSRATFETADTVYLANGSTMVDAMVGGTADDGPILLVTDTLLPAATAAELARLAPSRIVVIGGDAVIPDEILIAASAVVDAATG